ncbi:MAG: hypothetical protein MUP55_02470 [Candidatus Aenigmarchaeota archaeon]|nr:hypothetical protein [Candidatus Aenigmarchaeota archaeon]
MSLFILRENKRGEYFDNWIEFTTSRGLATDRTLFRMDEDTGILYVNAALRDKYKLDELAKKVARNKDSKGSIVTFEHVPNFSNEYFTGVKRIELIDE